MTSTFPLDIWISITDIMATEPNEMPLRMLSQTSKSMLPLCQRHIFSTLALRYYKSKTWVRYLKLLQGNPEIAGYLKTLICEIKTTDIGPQEEEVFEQLNKHACRLRKFKLCSLGRANWDEMPATAQALLVALIQRPTIATLEFEDFENFPIGALGHCYNLETLEMTELVVRCRPSEAPLVRASIPAPRTLKIGPNANGAISELMALGSANEALIDCTRVKSVMYDINPWTTAAPLCRILATAEELAELDMDVTGPPASLVGIGASIAANPNPALTYAIFSFSVDNADHDPLCGLSYELRQMAGRNVLEHLEVSVYVQTDSPCRTDSRDWADLDVALAAPGAFPLLRRVSISLNWYSFGRRQSDVDEILGKLTDRFPRLAASKAIAFEFEEKHEYI